MVCRFCGSRNKEQFQTEIAIHSHDNKAPLTFLFPRISVCLTCGKLEIAEEFAVPDHELQLLSKQAATSG